MTMSLRVLEPDGPLLSATVRSLRGRDLSGAFGLLAGHQDFCTVLVPCLVSYRDEANEEQYLAVDGGILLLEDGCVTIVTREAVVIDDVDTGAGEAAAQLAERRREERETNLAFRALVASLIEQMPVLERRR